MLLLVKALDTVDATQAAETRGVKLCAAWPAKTYRHFVLKCTNDGPNRAILKAWREKPYDNLGRRFVRYL